MNKEFTGKTDSYGNKLYLGDKVVLIGYKDEREEFEICKSNDYKEEYWMMGWAWAGIDRFKREYPNLKIKKVGTDNTETFTYESLPFIINFKVTDKNNNITYQTVDTDDATYKVIINGTTTIVILKDGSKGVSKCLPDDIYNRDKGIDIAYRKALIKSYHKELKELTK